MSADATHLLDANLLIALAWPNHVHHARAHDWLGGLDGRWATTPMTETAFLRLSTNAAVVGKPLVLSEALDVLQAMRGAAGHVFLPDDTSLADPGIELTRFATSRQVTDAHLVNLCAVRSAVLATLDRGIVDALRPADRRFVVLIP